MNVTSVNLVFLIRLGSISELEWVNQNNKFNCLNTEFVAYNSFSFLINLTKLHVASVQNSR